MYAASAPRTSADDDHVDGRRILISGSAGFEHEESLAVGRHVVMARGIGLGVPVSNNLAGVPMLSVGPDYATGTAVSAFDASR
jgi:hypothetical protein